MSEFMQIGERPRTPFGWVEFNKDLLESSDVLWCPICEYEVEQSLAVHVQQAGGHPSVAAFKEKYDGMPMTTKSYSERLSEGLKDDFGAFDWDRLDVSRSAIWGNREFLLRVEKSQLITSQSVFDELVEYFNNYDWHSVEVGVATSLLMALNGYSYIGAKEVGDELSVDPAVITRQKRTHPDSTPDVRMPQELLRDKLREIKVGDEEFANAYDELLSYPEEFRGGGRKPATIAALAAWRGIDRFSQQDAADVFGTTTVSIRNARDALNQNQ